MVKGALFSVEFPSEDFSFFGSTYTFKLGDGTVTNEFLVHFPTLIKYVHNQFRQSLSRGYFLFALLNNTQTCKRIRPSNVRHYKFK